MVKEVNIVPPGFGIEWSPEVLEFCLTAINEIE